MYEIAVPDYKLEMVVLSVCAEELDYIRDKNCYPI